MRIEIRAFQPFQIKPPHDKNIQKSILEHLKPESERSFSEDLSDFKGSLLFDPREEMCNEYYSMLDRYSCPAVIVELSRETKHLARK